MASVFTIFCVAATCFAARAVRLDDDIEAPDGVPPATVASIPTMDPEQMGINGSNVSREPYVIPSEGTGGKLVANIGCSKDLRKTIVSVDKPTFDVVQCRGLAKSDSDCGKEVYTDGKQCICVLKGKTCDVITIPGNTMFIPTTTAPPNPLAPPSPPPPCPIWECKSGSWLEPSAGDIPGPPYALGHTGNLSACKSKCCDDKLCEAIKFSPSGNSTEISDDCALYLDIKKFDRNATKDRDFTVYLYQRELGENETEDADPEAVHRYNIAAAVEARLKADNLDLARNKSAAKYAALDDRAKELEEKVNKSGEALKALNLTR